MTKPDPHGDGLKSEGDINLGSQRERWRGQLSAATRETLDRDGAVFLHQSLSIAMLECDQVGAWGRGWRMGRGGGIWIFHAE